MKAIELARIGEVVDADQVRRIEVSVGANDELRKKIEAVREPPVATPYTPGQPGRILSD